MQNVFYVAVHELQKQAYSLKFVNTNRSKISDRFGLC